MDTQTHTHFIQIHCCYLLGNKKQLLKFMQMVTSLIVSHYKQVVAALPPQFTALAGLLLHLRVCARCFLSLETAQNSQTAAKMRWMLVWKRICFCCVSEEMVGPLPGHCYLSFSHALALYRCLYHQPLSQLHQSADRLSQDCEEHLKIVFIVTVCSGMRLHIVSLCVNVMHIYLKFHYLILPLTQMTERNVKGSFSSAKSTENYTRLCRISRPDTGESYSTVSQSRMTI